MIITSINISDYLAEFFIGKYNEGSEGPVKIPDNTDVYHLVWQLMGKRPPTASIVSKGNLAIMLPDRRIGKDPMYYNFLSSRAAQMIEKRIKIEFNNDLHNILEQNEYQGRPLDNIEVIYAFMERYGIQSISEDALKKNYYRWKENVRKRKKRAYTKVNKD